MRFLVMLLLGLSTPALAQTIYTWVDEEGTTHFTDNKSSVPKDVSAQTTEGEPISYVLTGPDELDRAAAREREKAKPAAPAPVPPDVAAAQQAAAAQTLIAETIAAEARKRDEERWRTAFRQARERIAAIEQDIANDTERLEPDGLPLDASYLCQGAYVPLMPPATSVTITGGGQVAPGTTVGGSGAIWMGAPPPPPLYASPCWLQPNPEFERTRDRLAGNKAALERAKEALRDLERRAAFEAVPLEWRR